MKNLNILYYTWNEFTFEDGVCALRELGNNIVVSNAKRTRFDNDEKFITEIRKSIKDKSIDAIFSFNYFPDLSRIAMDENIVYLSWCFDSQHMMINSVTIDNPCNRVFVFDYALYEECISKGIKTLYYMPLACNVNRVSRLVNDYIGKNGMSYRHDITFLGRMYDDERNFYDQIKYIDPYVKGYIDATMEAQLPIFGMDMVKYLLNDGICNEILKTVNVNLGENYSECSKDILISMIQKKITVTERRRLLTVLGEKYKIDHYDEIKSSNLPVNYRGYASYMDEMPIIFATSKINLNITLRSIISGIPLRVIDILGAGGFCITNYQAELSEYFENDNSIVWYESYEELFEKMSFYIDNDAERIRIAHNGNEIIKDQFTYEKAFSRILDTI